MCAEGLDVRDKTCKNDGSVKYEEEMMARKMVRCTNDVMAGGKLKYYKDYEVERELDITYALKGVEGCWDKSRFEDVVSKKEQELLDDIFSKQEAKPLDSHYNFEYVLSASETAEGAIKVDPYFVASCWKLGEKDDTGVIFHILKTCARFGEKNLKSREINAIYKSIKRLAELEGVKLEG